MVPESKRVFSGEPPAILVDQSAHRMGDLQKHKKKKRKLKKKKLQHDPGVLGTNSSMIYVLDLNPSSCAWISSGAERVDTLVRTLGDDGSSLFAHTLSVVEEGEEVHPVYNCQLLRDQGDATELVWPFGLNTRQRRRESSPGKQGVGILGLDVQECHVHTSANGVHLCEAYRDGRVYLG